MSIVEVKVPQFSESVSEGTLMEWNKQVGEAVSQDETLIEIETDKVIMEVPSPADGVLVEIIVEGGSDVESEQLLAKIDTAASATAAAPAAEKEEAAPAPTAAVAADKGDVASPAAAKILSEKGLSASDIEGSGKDGRVTKADAQSAQKAAPAAAPVEIAQSLDGRPEQRVPMTRLRARVAERLLASQQENAILTTFNEVNMKPVMDLRAKYRDQFEKEHGVRLGFMSFFIKAAVAALKKYPLLNASIDGNDIVYHGYFDIGVAVSSPRGLVVPIVRNADQLSLADIEKTIAEFGVKAREGRLSIDELTGGTFSISNGGVFGSMMSTPIINPPQSAILGVHATKERPVVENGEIVIRPMNYLALSYISNDTFNSLFWLNALL